MASCSTPSNGATALPCAQSSNTTSSPSASRSCPTCARRKPPRNPRPMNAPAAAPIKLSEQLASRMNGQGLAKRLAAETGGEVLFDAASRGRYSTDASIYQVDPVGVFVPRTERDVELAIAIAREMGVPILPRGAGTSQCGQTVGEALV